MRLSIVLVHYHTPDLLERSVEALRRDLGWAGVEVPAAEWLVVDNGSDGPGRERIESLGVRRLDPGRNVGYAAGVNLGVARSTGDRLLVLNPDVLVLPGSTGTLLAALGSDAERTAVAGPRFFWDRERRLLLPPAERRSRRAEVATILARRHPWAARRARSAWRRHARRHWRAREPLASHALSGALLAFHRAVWDRVGPFDEGFRLYFEEVEWLERVRRAGGGARYVPGAEAVHLYDQSARAEPAARTWFEESTRRFRRLRYGAASAAALGTLERALAGGPGPAAGIPELPPRGVDLAAFRGSEDGPVWIEISPLPEGYPAAAERWTGGLEGTWRLPDEIAGRSGAGPWYLTVASEAGRELARARLGEGG